MPSSPEELVQTLADSGILPADKARSFLDGLPPAEKPTSGDDLLKALVKAGRLTSFQAKAVRQGKGKALVIGQYLVLEKIGAGGMGHVFKAIHRHLDRTVAIKMLPVKATAGSVAVARFQREVHAAARLHHPNIVTAYDANEQNGVHYLVMEYVNGVNLAELVQKRGPLPVGEAVGLIEQAARGLAYAHEQGIVHRDIKPSNLLLDRSGALKILDMGLARFEQDGAAADAHDPLTLAGQIMGTVDYMSPEQAEDTRQADAQSDIYSLGCTLYYLLTGRPLFGGETMMQRLMAHREDPVPSLRALRPEVPEGLDRLFQALVAKKPADRPPSMKAVLDLLADPNQVPVRALPASDQFDWSALPTADTDGGSDVDVPTTTPTAPVTAGPAPAKPTRVAVPTPTPRRRKVWPLAAGAGLLLVGVATAVALRGPHKDPEPPPPDPVVATQTGAEPQPPPPAPDFDRQAAEWVLGKGGSLQVAASDGQRTVRTPAELPAGALSVRGIDLTNHGPVRDEDLLLLQHLAGLHSLVLAGTGTNDAQLEQVGKLTPLDELDLSELPVTSAGLQHLTGLARLRSLSLMRTRVTDLGWVRGLPGLTGLKLDGCPNLTDKDLAPLAGHPGLTLLTLTATRVGDEGMDSVAQIAGLVELRLAGTPITDRGLVPLRNLTSLKIVGLLNTRVSEAGVTALRAALPQCVVRANPPTADRMAAQWVLGQGGTVRVTSGAATRELRSAGELPPAQQAFKLVAVNLTGRKDFDPASLAKAAELTALHTLNLAGTPAGDAALAALRKSPSLRTLDLTGTRVTDQGLNTLREMKGLTLVVLDGTAVTADGVAALRQALPGAKVQWFDDRPERQAAEWALRLGGSLVLAVNGKDQPVAAGGAVPQGAVRVRAINLPPTAELKDTDLARLAKLSSLTRLSLAGLRVTNSAADELAALTGLQELYLHGTSVTDRGFKVFLPELSGLRVLSLEGNKHLSDAGLAALKDATALRTLNLHSTAVTNQGLKQLRPLTGLVHLRLPAQIGDAGLAEIKTLTNLESLVLADTQITGAGLAHLQGLTRLQRLDLARTRVTTAGLAFLKDQKALREINLTKTLVNPRGFSTFQSEHPECRVIR